jgi:hypothetical protein
VDVQRSGALAVIEFEEDRRWLLPIRANITALLEDLPHSVVVSDTTLTVEQVRSMLARFLRRRRRPRGDPDRLHVRRQRPGRRLEIRHRP